MIEGEIKMSWSKILKGRRANKDKTFEWFDNQLARKENLIRKLQEEIKELKKRLGE
tara:strand:- start:4259 stop:4426 length:168 start_codon:yes stop_codon:yes gene_type:complete